MACAQRPPPQKEATTKYDLTFAACTSVRNDWPEKAVNIHTFGGVAPANEKLVILVHQNPVHHPVGQLPVEDYVAARPYPVQWQLEERCRPDPRIVQPAEQAKAADVFLQEPAVCHQSHSSIKKNPPSSVVKEFACSMT
jgi:hypothetical protein